MGNTMIPFVCNIVGMWAIRIVGTFICIYCFGMGLISAWACMIGHNLLLFGIFTFLGVTGRYIPENKRKKVLKNSEK